jgi:iron complex outermembrane receptor protein
MIKFQYPYLTLLITALLPCAAMADSGQEDDFYSLSLEDLTSISVASLFVEDEQYVGSSVSLITEQQWQRQGAEKTFDAIEKVPGVYLSEHVNGMVSPTFRGNTGPNQYNSFLVLLDGIPLNNYSSASPHFGTPNFALGNLQRIEVIRGPGSALYGADAFNGVVSLNSWDSDQDQIELRTELGQYGYQHVTGRLRQGLADNVSITSALSYSTVDDLEIDDDFTSGSNLVEAEVAGDYANITTSHKLQINDFEAAVYYSEHDVDDSYGSGESPFLPNGHHSDGQAKMKALKLSHQLSLDDNWQLESMAYYLEDELFGSFGLVNVGSPPAFPTFDWDSEDNRAGLKLNLKKPLGDDQRQMVFGINYDYMETEKLAAGFVGSPPGTEDENRDLTGAMGQLEQRFMDGQLQLIIGGRFDHYSDFGDNFSPRVAAIYHPFNRSALKFLYGEAFRAPAINEQADNSIVRGGGSGLNPEQVNTYELIWMQSADSWSYSINAYMSEVSDVINITLLPENGFVLAYANNQETESYGAELESSYQIKRWQFTGNIAYNQAKQTVPIALSDYSPAYPDVIANLGVQYTSSNHTIIAVNHIYQNGRASPSDPLATPSFSNRGLPSFARTDLHVSLSPEGQARPYEIFINVHDMFDRQSIKSAMNLIENGTATAGRRINIGFNISFF